MQTTVTIWIPKSDLEKFQTLIQYLDLDLDKQSYIDYNKTFPTTIYTEKMHVDCLQLNVSLDLFVKLNLK